MTKNNFKYKTKSTTAATTATAAVAFSAMLAFNACPARAFQSTFLVQTPKMMRHRSFSSPIKSATTAMRCSSPWGLTCGGIQPFGSNGFERWGLGPMVFAAPEVFQQNSQLQVGDPKVTETDEAYKLSIDLPDEVEEDDFDVSVTGRLLTVNARVTREDSVNSGAGRGGWIQRSSRTDSVSRSFVLPEGLSTSGATAALICAGKVEVKFQKDPAAAEAPMALQTEPTAAGSRVDKTPAPASSAEYLSGLSGTKEEVAAADSTAKVDVGTTGGAKTDTTASATEPEHPSRRGRSVFEVLDEELSEFSKAVWGEDVLRFPTEDEMVKRAEAVKEARAKRVMSMRRETMATDVSQTEDGSYFVKVALPEGATRHDISLTVTPENLLRVSFAAEGRRSISKDVRLPKDALFSEISAKFEAEENEKPSGRDGASSSVAGVSGLGVTVGRAVPPQPKRIEIL